MTGRLWRMIESHADMQEPYRPSNAQISRAVGYAGRQGIGGFHVTSKVMPDPDRLRQFAAISHFTYREVLDAALVDAGYLDAREVPDPTLRQSDFGWAAKRGRREEPFTPGD